MDTQWTWGWAVATAALLKRQRADRLARAAHARLREEWFRAVSAQKGSEVLAVQTLRNSLMSATVLASTAAIALMGTISLAAPALSANLDVGTGQHAFTPRLFLELVLLSLLVASLIPALMAVRLYNHAGFVGGMPVDSEARQRWMNAGVRYVRNAGMLYSVGLRQLVLVVPVVAALLSPAMGPLAAIVVAAVLFSFDRFSGDSTEQRTT
jgi:uncharacterized membrane protein